MLALYVLEGMLLVLLTVVGGLVIWLHFRIRALLRSNEQAPVLVDALSNSIHQAQRGVETLSSTVKRDGAKLDENLDKARDAIQDLDYMMSRAEKIMARMDDAMARTKVVQPQGGQPAASVVDTPQPTPAQVQPKPSETQEQQERSMLLQASRALEEEMKSTLQKVRSEESAYTTKNVQPQSPKTQNLSVKESIPAFLLGDQKEATSGGPLGAAPVDLSKKRVSTQQGGAQAYGRVMMQHKTLSDGDETEAEYALRQSLEGRL